MYKAIHMLLMHGFVFVTLMPLNVTFADPLIALVL